MKETPPNSKVLAAMLARDIRVCSLDESQLVVARLITSLTGLSLAEQIAGKPVLPEHQQQLRDAIERINRYEPWQYVVGETEFFGRSFKVNPSVLIPRPETEELTHRIVDDLSGTGEPRLLVDVGTGSGCIAVTLSLELPQHSVAATDVSAAALDVAGANAARLKARVAFFQHDILGEPLPWQPDVIVSNPPYVTDVDKESLAPNVIRYEPAFALFAGPDPMTFYRALAREGRHSLKPGGRVYAEIHERHGDAVAGLFRSAGFRRAEVNQDLAGKDRFLFATR
jgi:release factor glutamine methyltransferase